MDQVSLHRSVSRDVDVQFFAQDTEVRYLSVFTVQIPAELAAFVYAVYPRRLALLDVVVGLNCVVCNA